MAFCIGGPLDGNWLPVCPGPTYQLRVVGVVGGPAHRFWQHESLSSHVALIRYLDRLPAPPGPRSPSFHAWRCPTDPTHQGSNLVLDTTTGFPLARVCAACGAETPMDGAAVRHRDCPQCPEGVQTWSDTETAWLACPLCGAE